MTCGLTFAISKSFKTISTTMRFSEKSIQFLILVSLTSLKKFISFRLLTFVVHGEVDVVLGHDGSHGVGGGGCEGHIGAGQQHCR